MVQYVVAVAPRVLKCIGEDRHPVERFLIVNPGASRSTSDVSQVGSTTTRRKGLAKMSRNSTACFVRSSVEESV